MKKRYKLLLIIFISFLLTIFIYFFTKKDRFVYVSLGDTLSFNNFSTYNFSEYLKYTYKNHELIIYEYYDDYDVSENVNKILDDNNDNVSYYIKNADIITLSLGTFELNNYKVITEDLVNNYLNRVYLMLSKLSSLSKNVFLINVYNSQYEIVNNLIKEYCEENDIYYIDLNVIGNNHIYEVNQKKYLNYKGHKNIANFIIDKINF